ncbi:hypothetical protein Actkin_06097 [Actinokineospora sp. UTMC 2448]|nr:hypothetical protein Actkin_06097 [Actinokineospora sp. UTMC 2448]
MLPDGQRLLRSGIRLLMRPAGIGLVRPAC